MGSISGRTEQADAALATGDFIDLLDVSAGSGGKRVKKTVAKFIKEALGLGVDGSIFLQTQASDPAAPTGGVRVYAKLNGGKVTLYARFPTGAIQSVGAEP